MVAHKRMSSLKGVLFCFTQYENMLSSTLFSVFLHLIISHNGIIFASYCKCIIANKK